MQFSIALELLNRTKQMLRAVKQGEPIERFVLTGGLVPGYASLIGVILILGGCQLSVLGLIGHYLARVFEEVKGRPIYLLKQVPQESRWAMRTGPHERPGGRSDSSSAKRDNDVA